MTDAFTKFMPSFEAVIEFHKANIEALVQAQTTFLKGAQEISKEIMVQTQAHFEGIAVAAHSALAVKTLQEAVALHVDGSKSSYEKLTAASTKIGALTTQVANDAFAPIKARATVATETLMKPLVAA